MRTLLHFALDERGVEPIARQMWARYAAAMASAPPPPETVYTNSTRVACDGGIDVNPALGHPRVYMQIDDGGFAECGYCDKRFVLAGGPADDR